MSQPARALFMFLKLTKIPFEGQLISIQKGMYVYIFLKWDYIIYN